MTLGTRLSLTYLVVILIGMSIAAPLAWLAVERLYLDQQTANLLAQAQLTAAALKGGQQPSGALVTYSQLSNVSPGIHSRVIDAQGASIIDLTGPQSPSSTGLDLNALAQNAAGLVTPAELLSRPEIEQALKGHAATAIRKVDVTGGQPVLYAAAPVVAANGAVAQIVYLAEPLPQAGWSRLPAAIRWQIGGVVLVAVILAGGAGLLFARRIARPLSQLSDAASAVAAGDLNQAVPEDPAIVELGRLGRAFNTMTANLRQADQAKNAFIADVSHELRTPLTVIKGTIETLQDGALDDLTAREPFLASMERETERLIRLVNDLLVLTRADAGVLHLQPQPLDLAELARSRCTRLEQAAHRQSVCLEVTADVPPAGLSDCATWVNADPDRMAQVLDNLLDNALRYSPAGSVVRVNLTREGERVVCQVSDTGPGIAARHLPMIFERFYRADQARSRDKGGSGLGLAIVRGLVTAQGGEVSASSVVGQGTAIRFWLPAA